MQDLWTLMSEWRRAARQLNDLPGGSPEWQLAVEEVERARSAYLAEVAQVAARRAAEATTSRTWARPAVGAAYRSTN